MAEIVILTSLQDEFLQWRRLLGMLEMEVSRNLRQLYVKIYLGWLNVTSAVVSATAPHDPEVCLPVPTTPDITESCVCLLLFRATETRVVK